MKVNIIGAGYVGLVSGLVLASIGHKVRVLDNDRDKIDLINNKQLPFYEKGLENILVKSINHKYISAHEFKIENFGNPEIILICVGTPTVNKKISLSNIYNVGKFIGKWLKNYNSFCSIVIKSTVLSGTTDTMFKKIIEDTSKLKHKNGDFGLGMNPEFLREGNAVYDCMNPDRIIIGYEDVKTKNKLTKLYQNFNCKKIYTNSRTAEMSKYVNNTLLALQISAINELSKISNNLTKINFSKIIEVVNTDHRWLNCKNNNSSSILDYLIPGPGFGGSCFPKDLMALSSQSLDLNVKPHLLNAIIETNEKQPEYCIELLLKKIPRSNLNKNILFLGITFKPETNDLRESTSIKMIDYAIKLGCSIKFHDPFLNDNSLNDLDENLHFGFVYDWENEVNWADAIVIATSHKDYKKLSQLQINKKTIIFDPRSFLSSYKISSKQNYLSLG